MFFNVRDLALKPALFDLALEPGKVDFLDPKVRQKSLLYAKGKAELASELLDEIRIRAQVKVEMEADCDRCLEPAPFSIDAILSCTIVRWRKEAEEAEIDEGEAKMGFTKATAWS